MRRFILRRLVDDSGISGTGPVAEGVEFEDGQYSLSWNSRFHTVEIGPNVKTLLALHGHGGHSMIEWIDEEEGLKDGRKPN